MALKEFSLLWCVCIIFAVFSPDTSPAWPLESWQNQGLHVSTSGQDSSTCGASSSPCRSIKYALSRTSSGDTVYVHQGLYSETFILLKSNTRLLSVDGPLLAKVYSGNNSAVRFTDGISNAEIDGFEIYGDLNGGTSDRDGLVRIHDASNIVVRNCLAHDAPRDADVVKISGTVENILLDTLVLYNPATRSSAGRWQEVIDMFGSDERTTDGKRPVRNIILRSSWLFHTPSGGGDYLVYAKHDVENIVYENNIFGPSYGGVDGNPAVAVGTETENQNDPTDFVNLNAIVRNNIFVSTLGDGALGILNSDNAWVYNNVFYGASGEKTRSVIMLRGNEVSMGRVYIFNNIFQNNYPSKSGDGHFYWVRQEGTPSEFFHAYNLYYQNISNTDVDFTTEEGSLYETNPGLVSPQIPSLENPSLARISEIRAWFALAGNSPAINHGLDAVSRTGHPNWNPGQTDRRWDIMQEARPQGGSWDLGAVENQGDREAPAAPENLRFQ